MDLPLGLCEGVCVCVHNILCMTMLIVTTNYICMLKQKLKVLYAVSVDWSRLCKSVFGTFPVVYCIQENQC